MEKNKTVIHTYQEPYVDEDGKIVVKFDKRISRAIINQLIRTPDFVKRNKSLFRLGKDLERLTNQLYGK